MDQAAQIRGLPQGREPRHQGAVYRPRMRTWTLVVALTLAAGAWVGWRHWRAKPATLESAAIKQADERERRTSP